MKDYRRLSNFSAITLLSSSEVVLCSYNLLMQLIHFISGVNLPVYALVVRFCENRCPFCFSCSQFLGKPTYGFAPVLGSFLWKLDFRTEALLLFRGGIQRELIH